MLGFLAWLDDTQLSHFIAETTWVYPTLETMHTLGGENPKWVDAWGIKRPAEFLDEPNLEHKARGECWYRPGCQCPFSKQGIDAASSPPLAANTKVALERIYQLCAKKRTHARRDPSKILDPTATAES